MWCCVMLCGAVWRCVVLRCGVWCCVVLCCVVLCGAVWWYVALCSVVWDLETVELRAHEMAVRVLGRKDIVRVVEMLKITAVPVLR
jgi:hypothetical protein